MLFEKVPINFSNRRGGSRGRVQGGEPPPEMTCGFLIQLVFCKKKKKPGGLLVLKKRQTSAPPPKKKSWIRPCTDFREEFQLAFRKW